LSELQAFSKEKKDMFEEYDYEDYYTLLLTIDTKPTSVKLRNGTSCEIHKITSVR
jgi:hypothetical protein